MELLQEYSWPGNVRELENLIKQIVVRGDESIIAHAVEGRNTSLPAAAPESLPYRESSSEGEEVSLKEATQKAVQKTEKVLIKSALNKTNWNRKKAARLLKISYRSLLYKIKDYQIS
jgi:transcriptional regulator with PAS, ATPase and Fis domain